MTIKPILNYFKQMNVQIATYFLVFSMMIVLLLSVIYYHSTTKIILDEAERQTNEAVAQTSLYIEDYINKIRTLSDLIATRPDVIDALTHRDNRAETSLISMISLVKKSDSNIKSIAIISSDGKVATSDSDMFMTISDDMMAQAWYKRAINSKQMPVLTCVQHGAFTMNKEDWILSISREIVDGKGRHLGVVLIDIAYEFIEDYIEGLKLGKLGYSFIITTEGKLVYHPDKTYFEEPQKSSELINICKLGQGYKSDMGLITFKSNIKNSNWIFVVLSSLDNVETLKKRLISLIVLISALLFMSSIVVGIWFSKRLTKPIHQLEKGMMSVGERWQHVAVYPNSSQEVQSLTLQYNQMVDRMIALMNDLKEVEEERRIDSIKSLQSQINPHFLYNTLDTILWLSEFREHQKVVDVTKSLGRLLRIGLNSDQSYIQLKDELDYVKHYLNIQLHRYEDQLNFTIDGDSDALSCMVPKLILQPIVENAIYHGIRPKGDKGTITIIYKIKGDDLMIVIKDDGIGVTKKIDEQSPKIKLGGIGINNVDRRIKLICGNQYGLTLDFVKDIGTTASYKLPIIT